MGISNYSNVYGENTDVIEKKLFTCSSLENNRKIISGILKYIINTVIKNWGFGCHIEVVAVDKMVIRKQIGHLSLIKRYV